MLSSNIGVILFFLIYLVKDLDFIKIGDCLRNYMGNERRFHLFALESTPFNAAKGRVKPKLLNRVVTQSLLRILL